MASQHRARFVHLKIEKIGADVVKRLERTLAPALYALVTACASHSETSDQLARKESIKPTYQYVAPQPRADEVKEATNAYTKCIVEKAAALDDNISPANIIAQSAIN